MIAADMGDKEAADQEAPRTGEIGLGCLVKPTIAAMALCVLLPLAAAFGPFWIIVKVSLVGLWIGGALVVPWVAASDMEQRGRDGRLYALIAFFMPPIGLLVWLSDRQRFPRAG